MPSRIKDVNRIHGQNVVLYFSEPNALRHETGPSTEIPDSLASFQRLVPGRACGLVSPICDNQISVHWITHNMTRGNDERTECI
jgi:hypothetical protein